MEGEGRVKRSAAAWHGGPAGLVGLMGFFPPFFLSWASGKNWRQMKESDRPDGTARRVLLLHYLRFAEKFIGGN